MEISQISENLKIARQKIDQASKVSGVKDVTLVGITKTREPAQVADLIISGCTDVGENRVQEWEDKYPDVIEQLAIRDYEGKISRHLVGHLQSNKVKRALIYFDMFQSLDDIDLARRISRIAGEEQFDKINCLIQVKLGDEETKSGIEKEQLKQDFEEFISLPHIKIQGYMLIAPLWAVGEQSRPYFKEMKDLFESYKAQTDSRYEMKYLSMGMSSDFEVAIEEGANMVRIGRALFDGFGNV